MNRAMSAAVALLAVLLVVTLLPQAPTAAQGRRGGTLRYAHYAEPPTMDAHWTTAAQTSDISRFVMEQLFALDSKLRPQPLLVERFTTSADRKVYTFSLRQGIMFHHGREMVADDVVASLRRWGGLGANGRELFALVDSLSAKDKYTVEMRLKEPNALVTVYLALPGQAAVIYPKEVAEEAGRGRARRIIGTGPYRLVEHLPDRHIKLERFAQYKPRSEPGDGLAGKREAYFDTVMILPIPDPAVRIAGIQKGEYHFAHAVPPDEYNRLRQYPQIVAFVVPCASWLIGQMNKIQGPLTNKKLRQAIQAALDMEKVMSAAFGPKELWRLDPGLMPKEHYMWTDAGKELYNQKNVERARTLLREAGYQGQPVRWMTSPERTTYYTASLVAKSQLEAAGIKMEMVLVDWATLISRRNRADAWDLFTTGQLAPLVDPVVNVLPLLPNWPGWYESRDMAAFLKLMSRHTEVGVRKDLWQRAQRLFYEDAVTIKFGDFFVLHAMRRELRGVTGSPVLAFLNAWVQ
ncbi:MAG: ABC transporter substrate-binding protein [Armatimonadetes bacterium]|nr:ABC transporter substrate-binding protein [Armatimonadota bacterium]